MQHVRPPSPYIFGFLEVGVVRGYETQRVSDNIKHIPSLTPYSETKAKESNSIMTGAQNPLSPSLPGASTHKVEADKYLPGLWVHD